MSGSLAAHATVITGQTERFSSPTDSYFNSVDFWSFTSTGGSITFDVLEWGFGGNHFDSMIWLFNDDGLLGADDLVAQNDDSGATYGDGSITALDSYLSVFLAPGDYLFALGRCCNYGAHDIVDGLQYDSPGAEIGAQITQIFDYQVTVNGAFTNLRPQTQAVPEPGALALLGIGFVGMRLARAKRPA